DAQQYLELLASVATIERELARSPTELRTNPAMLQYLPAGASVYGAVPNPGLTISRALTLAQEQSTENPTFAAWWNSTSGQELRQIADRIQSVSPLLGEELVFSVRVAGSNDAVPMVMARVRPGEQPALANALQGLFTPQGAAPSYSIS